MVRAKVSIVLPKLHPLPVLIAEQLRYAGLINFEEKDNIDGFIRKFSMYPPTSSRTIEQQKAWANRNADRIRSFGILSEAKEIK
jgi:hypothetical protein